MSHELPMYSAGKYEPKKPWLYRCSNGEHILWRHNTKGQGFPPRRQPCDQTMCVWLPERGRVETPCSGVMLRQGWQVRDYVLARQRGMIAA